jgi:hypothetical protein
MAMMRFGTIHDCSQAAQKEAAKLNTQMQKIEHVFRDKGYDSTPFGKTPARGASGAAAGSGSQADPSAAAGGMTPSMHNPMRKRQRI